MSVKYIIWDFDGTLFNTYGSIIDSFANTIYQLYGYSICKKRMLSLVKVNTKHCAQILSEELDINEQELLTCAREVFKTIPADEQSPFDYARLICQKIELAGGANFLVTHRDRDSLDAMLSPHDFAPYFADIVTSDEGFLPKPSPESFNHVIKKHALPLDMTCGIGDREMDVLAANSAGIRSVYFCPEGNQHQAAMENISSLKELLSIVD